MAQIKIDVDEQKAATLGVNLADINSCSRPVSVRCMSTIS